MAVVVAAAGSVKGHLLLFCSLRTDRYNGSGLHAESLLSLLRATENGRSYRPRKKAAQSNAELSRSFAAQKSFNRGCRNIILCREGIVVFCTMYPWGRSVKKRSFPFKKLFFTRRLRLCNLERVYSASSCLVFFFGWPLVLSPGSDVGVGGH